MGARRAEQVLCRLWHQWRMEVAAGTKKALFHSLISREQDAVLFAWNMFVWSALRLVVQRRSGD